MRLKGLFVKLLTCSQMSTPMMGTWAVSGTDISTRKGLNAEREGEKVTNR